MALAERTFTAFSGQEMTITVANEHEADLMQKRLETEQLQPQKIQIGARVLLPNGKEAVVEEAFNAFQSWNNPYSADEWEYHVSFPSQGLGGRLNYKEDELRVWREVEPGHLSPVAP